MKPRVSHQPRRFRVGKEYPGIPSPDQPPTREWQLGSALSIPFLWHFGVSWPRQNRSASLRTYGRSTAIEQSRALPLQPRKGALISEDYRIYVDDEQPATLNDGAGALTDYRTLQEAVLAWRGFSPSAAIARAAWRCCRRRCGGPRSLLRSANLQGIISARLGA